MKYIIEINEIDTLPENPYNRQSWPSEGLYHIKSDNSMYCVDRYGVTYINNVSGFPKTEYEEEPTVTEKLFLKSLAAINGKTL